jgi:hypothetical protein
MSPPRRPSVRLLAALMLGAAGLLLGGCVYLRLLELKNQLADFDRFFAADLSDGLRLTFKKPVLLDEDMAFLKLAPESRQRLGTAERWHFRWIKAPAAADTGSRVYEETADFIFVEHKLAKLILPESFFIFFPKQTALAGLRAIGHATVDRAKRSVTSRMTEEVERVRAPRAADLTAALGAPGEILEQNGRPQWHYRLDPATTNQHSAPIDIKFTLDPLDHRVRHVDGVLFIGTFSFDFPDESPSPAVIPTPDGPTR